MMTRFQFLLLLATNTRAAIVKKNCILKSHPERYYSQITFAFGIPVMATRDVHPSAIALTCKYFEFLIKDNHEIIGNLQRRNHRVIILGRYQEISRDVFEYKGVAQKPHTRGLGGTRENPVTVIPEENVLCLKEDRQPGDIIIHELAHAIHLIGTPRGLLQSVSGAYRHAKTEGLFFYKYAGSNPREYFAVGVQAFFNRAFDNYATFDLPLNRRLTVTRADLLRRDPLLFYIIENLMMKSETWHLPRRCDVFLGGIQNPDSTIEIFDIL